MTRPLPPLTPEQSDDLVRDTEPYLSCEDCFDLMDAWVESVVAEAAEEPAGMREHLAGCAACAEEAASLRDLVRGQS